MFKMDLILLPELQLVLDDSERIRATLRGFRSVLGEISAVCDISTHEERLNRNDQQICNVQRDIVGPLEQLLQAVPVRVLKSGIAERCSMRLLFCKLWSEIQN